MADEVELVREVVAELGLKLLNDVVEGCEVSSVRVCVPEEGLYGLRYFLVAYHFVPSFSPFLTQINAHSISLSLSISSRTFLVSLSLSFSLYTSCSLSFSLMVSATNR